MERNLPLSLDREAFGKCPITGDNGGEVASDSASSSTNLDATGNGVALEKFRGKFYSPLGIDYILDKEDALRESRRHARGERFRSKHGFKNSI